MLLLILCLDRFIVATSSSHGGQWDRTSAIRMAPGTSQIQDAIRGISTSRKNPPLQTSILANVRSRIVNIYDKPPQTVTHLATAVSSLERWIASQTGTHKQIETLSPEELDGHLATYFPNLRKSDGSEYEWPHLAKSRSYIERFLRELGYPLSITRSPEFRVSQAALTLSKKTLQEKQSLEFAKRP